MNQRQTTTAVPAPQDQGEPGARSPDQDHPEQQPPEAPAQDQKTIQPESEFGLSGPPQYPDHEFAGLVAPLDEATIPALAEDIKATARGTRHPV
jgi:hypothetical protein